MYTSPTHDPTFDRYDEMRLHMEQLLSSSILELDMPMRIAIPLDDAGIRRLKDLVCLSREQLIKIKRIGIGTADEVERLLDRFGLSLNMTV